MMSQLVTAKYLCQCGLTLLSLTGVATAANFELSKFIEVGATTTDNLLLGNADSDKENNLIFNIKPSVELKYNGNRFGLVALGEVEYSKLNGSDEKAVDPRLFMRVRGTLVDNLLFLDSTLSVAKLSTSSAFLRPTNEEETGIRSNTTAYIEHSFGRTADLYAGYTFSTIAETTEGDFDVNQHTVDLSLGRDPAYGGAYWGIGGSYSLDESKTNEFEDAYIYGTLGTTINQTLLAEATYGIENRKLINAVNTGSQETSEYDNTSLWRAQLKWSPSEFTSLTVGYGERFFGRGPNMQLRHRISNSSILASYTRDLTRQETSLNNISILGDIANPTVSDTDNVTIDGANNLSPQDEPFVDNRFQVGYKLAGRRSDIIVDAVYSKQEPLTGTTSIQSLLGRLVFDRRLSEFLSLRLQYDYQKREASDLTDLNYDENRFAFKLIYSFDGNEKLDEDEY